MKQACNLVLLKQDSTVMLYPYPIDNEGNNATPMDFLVYEALPDSEALETDRGV
ncbi:MAG: hypothetical protein LBR06_00075 [Bacteroidales bacterium]|jgi:hypothetical protein|nr:hypothetical protein [Bacteroidales bacterium]